MKDFIKRILNRKRDHSSFAKVKVDVSKIEDFRFEKFPYEGPYPWLDNEDAKSKINKKLKKGILTQEEADLCNHWSKNGYVILKNVIPHNTLDKVWNAYEQSLVDKVIVLDDEKISDLDPYPGRFLNPHARVPEVCEVMRHPTILKWVNILTEREPIPFQTISAHKGSQQGEHSDSIHMTTYPIGYLTAAWIAFEDIHPDSGPLIYYPGSHKLPYVFCKDVGITKEIFQEKGYASYYESYEPAIKEVVDSNKLEPHYFHAGKGDVLIWHANLIHGGSKRNNHLLSRKSIVAHYFVEGAFCYHDLSGGSAPASGGTCLLK